MPSLDLQAAAMKLSIKYGAICPRRSIGTRTPTKTYNTETAAITRRQVALEVRFLRTRPMFLRPCFHFWLNGVNNGTGSIRPLTDNPPVLWDAGFPLWVGARWDLVNPRMRGEI